MLPFTLQPLGCVTGRWKGIVNRLYFLFIVLVFLYDYAYNAVSCVQSEHCTGLISKFAIPPIIHFSSFLCGAYYFRGRNGMDTSRGLIEAVFLQSTRTYVLPCLQTACPSPAYSLAHACADPTL